MVKLNRENLTVFIEMLEEEHTIHNDLIPTIYDILIEATGYVEVEVEVNVNRLSKKERYRIRNKNRVNKQYTLNQNVN